MTIIVAEFRYSGHENPTTTYPAISELIRVYYHSNFADNVFQKVFASLDILLSNESGGGGKTGAHGDSEQPWGLVLIFSLGQTRWLRIRRKEDKREW